MSRFALRRASVRQFFAPLGLYAAGCLLAAVVFAGARSAWLVPLFATGGVVVLLVWRRIPWPDGWMRYLSFGAVLLLVCAINRLFYLADYVVAGARFDEWPFWVQSPRAAVFKGEVIAIAGTLLTVWAWRACGGMRISPAVVLEKPRQTFGVVAVLYVLALVGAFVSERVPMFAAAAGQLLPTLLGLGLVCTFLIPLARLRNGLGRLLATLALSVPFVLLASGSGMKTNIILAFLPGVAMAWRYFRSPLLRGVMVATGIAAIALIAAYVNFYRAEVWIPEAQGSAPSDSVPSDFLHKVGEDGVPATLARGLAAVVARENGSVAHGWTVSIADEQGLEPQLVFAPMAYVFVPRVLWPDKPPIQQGRDFTALVFGPVYAAHTRTSTAAGFYPALYLGLGWPAVVAGALLLGALLAGVTLLARRIGGSLAAGLYILSMLPAILHLNENWTVGAFAGPVVDLVYVLVMVTLARAVARVVAGARRVPATHP